MGNHKHSKVKGSPIILGEAEIPTIPKFSNHGKGEFP